MSRSLYFSLATIKLVAKRSLGAMRDGCLIENQRRQIRIHVSPKVSPDESGLKDFSLRTTATKPQSK
ncbi:MAG: hypothetical protein DME50_11945 [Verrucomicrobia bacterium]|nr:MAG: hypothetical protein DME50_11945 [Verrucomicrobiota bacterium]